MRIQPAVMMSFVLTARPTDAVDPQALAQVQEYAGAGCPVEVLQAKAVLWGNNGFRIEHWNVRTRDGIARFEVSYHPLPYCLPVPTRIRFEAPMPPGKPSRKVAHAFHPQPLAVTTPVDRPTPGDRKRHAQ